MDEHQTSKKCIWCSQVLCHNDLPKLLECLHVACQSCITNKLSENENRSPHLINCPICNMVSRSDRIIENQFLIEEQTSDENQANADDLIAEKSAIKCSSCNDDANATSWCVDCSEFICDNCVKAHQRLKITKDHTIKPKDEGLVDINTSNINNSKFALCKVHTQEKLALFCETCDRLTCRDCQLVDHRDHKYKFANELAIETRTNLNTLLSEISYKRVLLTSAMKVIADRQTLIADKKKGTR